MNPPSQIPTRWRRFLSDTRSTSPEAGLVEEEFRRTSVKYLSAGRGAVIAVISLFGVIGSPSDALPAALAVLVLSVVVGALECVYWKSLKTRYMMLGLVIGRAAAVIAVQGWTEGVSHDGRPNAWALNVLTITAGTLQCVPYRV